MRIRRYRPADSPAVGLLISSTYADFNLSEFPAETGSEVIGVLRGRRGRLQSLFVSGDHQRLGVGTALVKRFEGEIAAGGGGVLRVASTRYGVPFYQAMGYRRTTGERRLRSFQGEGLPYQPMKKIVGAAAGR
ncbi:MAG: GNAT family N-acetyltransferase [Acidimicrobiia bacterium]|nr:GNAT family N-acetyltransferase [Acidimicrobiia bacterium]